MLQECTSRHAFGILSQYHMGPAELSSYPSSPEEYAVYALSLQNDKRARMQYNYSYWKNNISNKNGINYRKIKSHGEQLLQFIHKIVYTNVE